MTTELADLIPFALIAGTTMALIVGLYALVLWWIFGGHDE